MSAPTLGTIFVDTDLSVAVPVDAMGENPGVRVDYAVGGEPPEVSLAWQEAGTVTTPATVNTPVQLRGSTVWIRGVGVLSDGEQSSGFTATQSVVIDEQPGFDSLSVTLTDRRPVVAWTGNADAVGILIQWVVHDSDVAAPTFTDSADIEEGYAGYDIDVTLQLGQSITVEVSAWSAFSSGAVAGDQGEVVTVIRTAQPFDASPVDVRLVESYEYTLTTADANAYVRCSDPTGFLLYLPLHVDVALPVGTRVYVEQADTGPVTIMALSGVTANALDDMLTTAGQFAVVTMTKVAINEWTIAGDLVS
jgi:hypothetical protein